MDHFYQESKGAVSTSGFKIAFQIVTSIDGRYLPTELNNAI